VPALRLELPLRAPFAVGPLRRFVAAHAVPGLEHHDATTGRHSRLVRAPSGPAHVTVDLGAVDLLAPEPRLPVHLHLADDADDEDRDHVVAAVRRWLDLDLDPGPVDAALARHELLAPLVAARPGLRVPGAVDGGETLLLTVLGQQVSLAAARTFAARLVAAFGGPAHATGLRPFPTPARLAAAGPDRLREAVGVTGARARCLQAVAVALADGLDLHPGTDPVAARAALLALPGIGPWTTEYVALRTLVDRDAYPSGDLVLKRAVGASSAREAERTAEPWRPWRGHALLHLWTREVFV
jgi:3-methyladenine DNA glycosylase/8-oxoguanine DNA glycosylase